MSILDKLFGKKEDTIPGMNPIGNYSESMPMKFENSKPPKNDSEAILQQVNERFSVYEQSLAKLAAAISEKNFVSKSDLATIIAQLWKEIKKIEPATVSSGNSGSGSSVPVQIEYSTTTHILRFSTDGGTTWTTIATAVSA